MYKIGKYNMKTLENYLREAFQNGEIDHSLRVTNASDGRVTFYIHQTHRSGDTLDFEVSGNELKHNRDIDIRVVV